MKTSTSAASRSPRRRIAFRAWAAVLVIVFGVGFFGLISLAIGWFQGVEGVAGPVTELGYGTLVGIILTMGLLAQLNAPERKIAGLQQAALVTPALLIGSAIASDSQNVVPALILLPAVGILLALHPAREEFLRRGAGLSRKLLVITILGAIPLVAYALDMGVQAQDLVGPPHHVQRLSTMAAMAIAIVLVGLLAAFKTRGWRISAWSAGAAAIVFGLASLAFPDDPGAVGRGWGGLAIAGGVLFIAVAESECRSGRATPELRSTAHFAPLRRPDRGGACSYYCRRADARPRPGRSCDPGRRLRDAGVRGQARRPGPTERSLEAALELTDGDQAKACDRGLADGS